MITGKRIRILREDDHSVPRADSASAQVPRRLSGRGSWESSASKVAPNWFATPSSTISSRTPSSRRLRSRDQAPFSVPASRSMRFGEPHSQRRHRMRGDDTQLGSLRSYRSPGQRVPKDYPLRAIRGMVETLLKVSPLRTAGFVCRPALEPSERLLLALIRSGGRVGVAGASPSTTC